MTDTLHSVLHQCALDLLETEREVDVDKVVACAYANYGDTFRQAQERLVWDAARRIAKNIMRDLADDDDDAQIAFPGLELPSSIAVHREDDSYYYVRADKATWPELEAGLQVRVTNVDRAQAKLDVYRAALNLLRPYMTDDSTTVAEGYAAHRKAQDDVA